MTLEMVIGVVLAIVDLVFLILIWNDGRIMRAHSAESVEIQRESLDAQRQYLDLRRRWYEQRNKKKDAVKDDKVSSSVGDSQNN